MKSKYLRYSSIICLLTFMSCNVGCTNITQPIMENIHYTLSPSKTTKAKNTNTFSKNITDTPTKTFMNTWTPYMGFEGHLLIIAEMDTDLGPRLYIVDADGNNLEMLSTNDIISVWHAEWSPDGNKIAFLPFSKSVDIHGYPDGESLRIVNSDGTNLKTLVSKGYFGRGAGDNDDISWSPDGTRIVYSNYMSDIGGDLFLVWMDGSKKRLTNTIVDEASPEWISNSEVIYNIYGNKVGGEFHVINVETNEDVIIDIDIQDYIVETFDLHCGKWILSKGDNLYIKTIGKSDLREISIVKSDYSISHVKWSPNCRMISYVSESLFIISLEDMMTTKLFTIGIGDPYWSPDSTRIAYESSNNIYILNTNGTRIEKKISNIKDLTLLGWQPG